MDYKDFGFGMTTAMLPRPFDLLALRQTLQLLLQPNVIGTFHHFEVIEVVGTRRQFQPCNILSVAVACEANQTVNVNANAVFQPLSVQIDGFRDWRFGLNHYRTPLPALDQAFLGMSTGQWCLSGKALAIGPLKPQVPTFAPANGSVSIPINAILKNNFWSGSHILRLLDPDKTWFEPFLRDRRRLQILSDSVAPFFPLAFAGLADFLGDIVIQLPTTILTSAVRSQMNNLSISATWRPGITPLNLRAAARTRWDGLLVTSDVSDSFRTSITILVDGHEQPVESELWDEQSKVILAATAPTSTMKQASVQIHVLQHEPRLFQYLDEQAQVVPARVSLMVTSRTQAGSLPIDDAIAWRNQRQDLEEKRRLDETRDFVQYRPQPGSANVRKQALDDLRYLISQHGMDGVDLWDPYLTADDILQTLFWCPHSSAHLRALTDGRTPPRPKDFVGPFQSFEDQQRSVFRDRAGNREHLQLEYRGRKGPEGWAFHDRFLIFPGGPAGPSAWSLGTSVNSLGTAHHILQKVANPALVAGAFEDLWNALNRPTHLIWSSP